MLTDSDICSVFSPSIIHPSPSSPTHQAWVCTGGGGGMVARRLVKRGYLKQHDCPAGSTQITFACAIPSTFLCVYFTQGGHLEHSSYQSLSELFNSGNSEFHILQMRKRAIGTTHLLDQNKRDLAESYRASVCLPFCTLPVGGERFNTFSTFGLKQSKCQNDHSMVWVAKGGETPDVASGVNFYIGQHGRRIEVVSTSCCIKVQCEPGIRDVIVSFMFLMKWHQQSDFFTVFL